LGLGLLSTAYRQFFFLRIYFFFPFLFFFFFALPSRPSLQSSSCCHSPPPVNLRPPFPLNGLFFHSYFPRLFKGRHRLGRRLIQAETPTVCDDDALLLHFSCRSLFLFSFAAIWDAFLHSCKEQPSMIFSLRSFSLGHPNRKEIMPFFFSPGLLFLTLL